MFHVLMLCAVCFCGLLFSGDLREQLRIHREIDCPLLSEPLPVGNHDLTDAWRKLTWSGSFVVLDSLWVEAPVKTEVALARDAEYLYLGMKMTEPQVEKLRGREKFSIWQNDAAEFFLWKRGVKKEWLHLAVDSSGKVYFVKEVDVPEMPGTCRSVQISGDGLRTGVQITDDGWVLTAALPMKLVRNYFGEGSRVNFNRQRRSPYGFSCWSKVASLRDYDLNGIVRLGNPEGVLANERRYCRALVRFQAERKNLVGRFKSRIYEYHHAFSAFAGVDGYEPMEAVYTAERGRGWISSGKIHRGSLQDFLKKNPAYGARLKKKMISPLADTYLWSEQDGTFRLDLPDGRYKVHLLAGLILPETRRQRRCFVVEAQGREIIRMDIGHELYARYDFPVVVRGGKLLLTFRGVKEVLKDNPATIDLSKGEAEKYYFPGWLLNSLVVVPSGDWEKAARQIAVDELELTHCQPEVLGNYVQVKYQNPELKEYPAQWQKRGYAIFTRPFGHQLYPESRPRKEELTDYFSVQVVPGEPLLLNFGLLPLRNLQDVGIAFAGGGIRAEIQESRYVSKLLGGGKYTMAPLFNDFYANVDHDCLKGQNRWIWINGRIPKTARPGKIRASLVIEAEGRTHRYPVDIEVLPFRVEQTDFAFGGYNPLGYNRPGRIYEDRLAELCGQYELDMHIFYLDPHQGEKAWDGLKRRLRLYQSRGVKGPFVVYVYLPIEKVDVPLQNHKISRIPDDVMKVMIDTAGRMLKMHREEGFPELIYCAMDEAHCKGDPYWSEQIRLNQEIKKHYPEMKTAASESDRSVPRIGKALDAPIVFEVDDYRIYEKYPRVYSYTNQYLLEPNDMNSGRMQCGWIPATVRLDGLAPWMLFCGTGESGFRYGIWNMIQQRGVGGYHYVPKLCTLMGMVGRWDLRYVLTLKKMIAQAENSGVKARKEAASEAQELLNTIREATRPSIKYYYYNGYWPPESFVRLREILVEQILKLQKAEDRK